MPESGLLAEMCGFGGHCPGIEDEWRLTKDQLGDEDVEAVEKGCANLLRHIENIKQFGVPVVVAINHFVTNRC